MQDCAQLIHAKLTQGSIGLDRAINHLVRSHGHDYSKPACKFDPLQAAIGVEKGQGKMKLVILSQYVISSLGGPHFNADDESNLNADLHTQRNIFRLIRLALGDVGLR